MKFPEEVRDLLRKKFVRSKGEWLAQALSGEGFRLEIPLGVPSGEDASRQSEAVRRWVRSWADLRMPGEVTDVERRFRDLGSQTLPERLVFDDPAGVAEWAGESGRWERAFERASALAEVYPELSTVLPRHFDRLADEPEEDFRRLESFLAWLAAHPASGLYPRQIPVEGMDSKWLEGREGCLKDLAAAVLSKPSESGDFHFLCGLRRPPSPVRVRLLDPALRILAGGLSDISAPAEDLARLPIAPRRVFVAENLQTGLAFPDLPDSAVVMGLGYRTEPLSEIPWVHAPRLFYWGDIDTHGFAILSRARTRLPGLRSLLMDEETLLSHRALWVTEEKPAKSELANLTGTEARLCRALRENRFGQNVRLEQERVRWEDALRVIRNAVEENE